jgi:hypothetical protein
MGVVLFAAAGWSQTSKPADDAGRPVQTEPATGASTARADQRSSLAGARAPAASYSSAIWEYWVNLTIPAGSWLDLDSVMDFSHAGNVRVSVRCLDASLGNVVLAAYWTVPQAPFFNVADVVEGNTFYYRNVGGTTFNAYGSRFRLRIINNGVTGITLSQVLLFARSQY